MYHRYFTGRNIPMDTLVLCMKFNCLIYKGHKKPYKMFRREEKKYEAKYLPSLFLHNVVLVIYDATW